MILRQTLPLTSLCFVSSRPYSSTVRWRPLKELQDGHLETFRAEAFVPSKPALLPRKHLLELPAVQKWFLAADNAHDESSSSLNRDYLDRFENTIVPLEFTTLYTNGEGTFHRTEVTFSIFLQWANFASRSVKDRLYLAQASFASLPKAMTDDLPTPEIVSKAGTGDIYDTNIWMGIPPTYTPLHRDPNPNLFVQLAGTKVVRILEPSAGDQVFGRVQHALARSGSAAFRGDDMMKGRERKLLESAIWDDASQTDREPAGYGVYVEAGDCLFIPKGWWHSIKGVGEGITASVNWWFR